MASLDSAEVFEAAPVAPDRSSLPAKVHLVLLAVVLLVVAAVDLLAASVVPVASDSDLAEPVAPFERSWHSEVLQLALSSCLDCTLDAQRLISLP